MNTKWKKGFNPEVILNKFKKIIVRNEDGISFSGFEYHQYLSVLTSMVEIDNKIPKSEHVSIITNGFHRAAKQGNISEKIVINTINKESIEYLSKPTTTYILITTINIKSNTRPKKITLNHCEISFYKKCPKLFIAERELIVSSQHVFSANKNSNFQYFVIAKMIAKSPFEAGNQILEQVDTLRGILNLLVNNAMVLRFGGKKEQINQIVLGEIHTLHFPDGKMAFDGVWYESEYQKNKNSYDFDKNKNVIRNAAVIIKLIEKSKYKNKIYNALIRYARALDLNDYDSAMIKLWGIFESLLSSSDKDSYDKLIKRAVFIYKDRKYEKQVLEHLKNYRNNSIHHGTELSDIDSHIYQMKYYVQDLIKFHIFNKFNFKSFEESIQFLDMPIDAEILKDSLKLYQFGIKFLNKT